MRARREPDPEPGREWRKRRTRSEWIQFAADGMLIGLASWPADKWSAVSGLAGRDTCCSRCSQRPCEIQAEADRHARIELARRGDRSGAAFPPGSLPGTRRRRANRWSAPVVGRPARKPARGVENFFAVSSPTPPRRRRRPRELSLGPGRGGGHIRQVSMSSRVNNPALGAGSFVIKLQANTNTCCAAWAQVYLAAGRLGHFNVSISPQPKPRRRQQRQQQQAALAAGPSGPREPEDAHEEHLRRSAR